MLEVRVYILARLNCGVEARAGKANKIRTLIALSDRIVLAERNAVVTGEILQ
jgi:hypothetical protein